jgi:hypothetical protein
MFITCQEKILTGHVLTNLACKFESQDISASLYSSKKKYVWVLYYEVGLKTLFKRSDTYLSHNCTCEV